MRDPIIVLLLLALLSAPVLAQSSSGLSNQRTERIFLRISKGTHLDIQRLQALGVRIVSIRPDPSGEADAVVEAVVSDQTMRVLEQSGVFQKVPATPGEVPAPDGE